MAGRGDGWNLAGLGALAAKANRQVGGIIRQFGAIGVGVAAATGALSAFFGIITGRTGAAVNNLTLLSKRLGLPIEQLSALETVLAKDNITISQFNSAISTMTQGVYDAAGGAGSALVPFIRLGLDFRRLINLPVAEQFFTITDALRRFEPYMEEHERQTHLIALATRIFGAEGERLLSVLEPTDTSLRDLTQAAQDSGTAIEEDVAEPIRRLAVDLVELKTELSLITTDILAFVAGPASVMVNALTSIASGVGRITENLSKVDFGAITDLPSTAFDAVKTALGNILRPFIDLWNRMAGVIPGMEPIDISGTGGGGTTPSGSPPPGVGPAPGVTTPRQRSAIDEALMVFPQHLRESFRDIARLESGFNRFAHNIRGEDSVGLFQINRDYWSHLFPAGSDPFDPVTNARAAYQVWRAQGFGAWRTAAMSLGLPFGVPGSGAPAPSVSGTGPVVNVQGDLSVNTGTPEAWEQQAAVWNEVYGVAQ